MEIKYTKEQREVLKQYDKNIKKLRQAGLEESAGHLMRLKIKLTESIIPEGWILDEEDCCKSKLIIGSKL